jgi:hypothetical protein
MNDPLDYLHGAEYRTLEYDEQAQVKRLMQAGVARIENHKGKRIVILDLPKGSNCKPYLSQVG